MFHLRMGEGGLCLCLRRGEGELCLHLRRPGGMVDCVSS